MGVEYATVCKNTASCDKYFFGNSQCDVNNNCGWTYLAATSYCKSFGPGYGLVKINNQYQNNAYNSLDGEGAWDLAWIGASCSQVPNKQGEPVLGTWREKVSSGQLIPAWIWQADSSTLLDGYSNFDWSIDPTTCDGNQCLVLGGTGYNGKWSATSCDSRMGDAICAENFNTDAPTPAPNVPLTCDVAGGWQLFPNPNMPSAPGRLGPTKCYQMLSNINGVTREFTWNEAKLACEAEGGGLAKVEDIQTNAFINSFLGGGAYGQQWIGGKCVMKNGVYRYRWVKDNELVAASYTNFPVDWDTGMAQEINPCNAKTDANPTGSSNMCMVTAGVGYNYQWSTNSCDNVLGDAICEKIPNGGSDDTPGANKKKKKSKGGAIAAGILVPGCILAAGFMVHKYYLGGKGFVGQQQFVSTSYTAADDGTAFSAVAPPPAGGAASL
jgi:hypothetical protein